MSGWVVLSHRFRLTISMLLKQMRIVARSALMTKFQTQLLMQSALVIAS